MSNLTFYVYNCSNIDIITHSDVCNSMTPHTFIINNATKNGTIFYIMPHEYISSAIVIYTLLILYFFTFPIIFVCMTHDIHRDTYRSCYDKITNSFNYINVRANEIRSLQNQNRENTNIEIP